MAPDTVTAVAITLLAVAAILLANPIYLQEDDRGNQFVQVERVSPADGTAMRSADAERVEQLTVVVRHAARQSLDNGSFRLNRDDPPLAVQLLGAEWEYIGAHSADQVFRPNVSVGDDETTVTFTPVPVEAVEQELGVTPPEGVRDEDSPREIIWLSDQTDTVVFVGEFADPWEKRFGDAVRAGELSVSNGNNASTFAPLGGDVSFVVDDGRPYRISVRESNRSIILETSRVSNETLLAETDITTTDTDELSQTTREIVVGAIEAEDGSFRYAREDVDMEEIEELSSSLIRHDGQHYVLYRNQGDDFSLVPLVRLVLTGLGALVGVIGLYAVYRARLATD